MTKRDWTIRNVHHCQSGMTVLTVDNGKVLVDVTREWFVEHDPQVGDTYDPKRVAISARAA